MHDLANVFLSYYVKEFDRIRRENVNLAHYTNILSGYSILKKKEIWLRNITKMSDNMEVKWGLELFKIFLYDNNNLLYNRLTDALAKAHKDAKYWKLVIDDMIDNFYEKYAQNTYILSLTEYSNKNIDINLFKNFCKDEGIIFVFNSNCNNKFTEMLNLTRVVYFDGSTFKRHFNDFIEFIETNKESIESCNLKDVEELLKQAIFYAILSIKHPSFKDENEWRIVYCSEFGNYNILSDLIVDDNVEIKGNLEKIYKINLDLLNKNNLLCNVISIYEQNEFEQLLNQEINKWQTFNNENFVEYKIEKQFKLKTKKI